MTITNAIITAWCLCNHCVNPVNKGLTAIGTRPRQGITIAGPRSIPLGTWVTISGHKYRVEDRTAKRWNGRWDIYFRSHRDAINFGKQTNNVTIGNK